MSEYLTNRQRRLNIGISSYTEHETVLDVIGNVNVSGIITAFNLIGDSISANSISVSGISTLGNVQISSGIVTASTGIVTYYGDGSKLLNIISGISILKNNVNSNQYIPYIQSIGSTTGLGVTDTFVFNPFSGNLGIGNTNPQVKLDVLGSSNISANLNVSGISTLNRLNSGNIVSSGIITAPNFVGNLSGTATTATDVLGGIGSITTLTVSGISTLNRLNSGNIVSSGIITATNFVGNLSGTATNSTNILGGIGSITSLTVSGISTLPYINSTNINATGIITASNFVGNLSGTATNSTNVLGGIGSITSLTVSGISTLNRLNSGNIVSSGIVTASTFVGPLTGTATTATKLENIRTFQITGPIVASAQNFDGTQNVSLASSIQPDVVGLGTHTYGDYVKNITGTTGEIEVSVTSGEGVSPQIGLPNDVTISNNLTVNHDLQINHDLNVNGNITIGGTSAFLNVNNLLVKDRDIVSGYTVDISGNDISTDITANTGGIAVASTEGSPIINLNIVGIETLPPTYKKLMWFKENSFAGLGTDAWMFNYGVGIGSTQIPFGTRLAVGGVQITDQDLVKIRNINASGIITATNFVGNLSGNTTTATYASTAGIATYATSSGIATYATNVIGGIGSITTLNVSGISTVNSLNSGNINSSGIITASQFTTSPNGIGINTNTIYGPDIMIIDPAAVGDDTGILRIKGDLYVDGTQTIINSRVVEIADYQIGIGTTAINDIVLDGAGIGIGSISNRKTFTWEYTTTSLKSSENINLNFGKVYKINGVDVLTSTTLGSGILNSYLTSVGTLNSLNVSGISTLPFINSTNINASGIITATNFVGNLLGNATTATYATSAGIATYATSSGIATYATSSGIATYATSSGIATYAPNAGIATYAPNAGIATYASTAGIATYATSSGIATYAPNAGIATYASTAGIATNVIGGIGSITSLTVSGISTFTNGPVFIGTATSTGTISQNLQVVGGSYISGSVGIGTTNPQVKLQVGGTIGFNDTNIKIGDSITGCSISSGINNIFLGSQAGCANTSGSYNNFFGLQAGSSNTTGVQNNFFGRLAGRYNTGGNDNNFYGNTSGYSNTTGSFNNFLGRNAGFCNTTGCHNFFVGQCAGYGGTGGLTGSHNIFFGINAGCFNTTGSQNNFFGRSSGRSNTGGCNNNFLGDYAGRYNTTGSFNNFLGCVAGYCNTTGSHNFFVGQCAGYGGTGGLTGCYNIFFGLGAGKCNTTGCHNNFIGRSAGFNNTTAGYNNFLGSQAGYNNTTGCFNNFFGSGAGCSNTTGNFNNFFGLSAGCSNTTGCQNNFFGPLAGRNNTGGNDNNFIGNAAGLFNTTGRDNNFLGDNAGFCNTTGCYNNFFGKSAGFNNTTGLFNNFLGRSAGYCNTTGSHNFFVGQCAGYGGTGGLTGCYNIFFGLGAGKCNTTGCHNNFIGRIAGFNNTIGGSNNFLGYNSGLNNTTGCYNNFFGQCTGYSNTTGGSNNFFGFSAGICNNTGGFNNFLGTQSGCSNTTGCFNNFFGHFTGISTSASNKVIIGRGFNSSNLFDSPNTTKDTQLAIGVRTDSNPAKYWIVGDENFNVGIGTTNPTSKLHVGGNVLITGIVTASSFVGDGSGLTNVPISGIVTYAPTAGIATNVIGGIASVTNLTVSGVSTLGFITGTDAYFTGIVTATKYYGDGTSLSGIVKTSDSVAYSISAGTATTAINVVGGIGSITALTVSGISTLPFINSTNINATGIITANSFVGNLSGNVTTATYATSAGIATYASNAGIATYATSAGIATYANNAGIATYATSSGIATYASTAGISTYTSTAGIATYATSSGIATYATSAGIATYATSVGIATYAISSGIATYATSAGIATYATYATNAGIATYASNSGISTISQGLTGTPNVVLGITTASSFVGNLTGTATTSIDVIGGIGSITALTVSGVSTLGSVQISSGIVTAASGIVTYYGDGSKLSNIISGITIATNTTNLNQYIPYTQTVGSITGLGVTNTFVFNPVYGNLGIGSTNPQTDLDVLGDTNLTGNINVSGISTLPFIRSTNINATGVITATNFVGNLTGTATTATNVIGGIGSITAISVSGISTFGTVQVSSGIVTASSGIVTYYGDGSKLSGVVASAQISIYSSTINSNQLVNFSPGFGSTIGLAATNTFVFNASSGNLGIGTTNPIQPFQVGAAGTTVVVVDILGEVGIGTTNPSASLHVVGDVKLDDGGTYTTTLQTITATANRIISLPDATGTVALVAGSSGQITYNLSGIQTGDTNLTYNSTTGLSLGTPLVNTYTSIANTSASTFTGTWFTGGTSTTTKPHVLIEPSGTTSTAWNTGGTGIGINATSAFAGNLFDAQVNGTSQFAIGSAGQIIPVSNVLEQRNSTNAQTYRVYNTYTSATSYERGKFEWSTNILRIGTEKGSGGGTARNLELQTDGTTRVTITSAGLVGIGIAPTAPLHVSGNAIIVGIVTATMFVGNLTGTATTATNVIGGIGSITAISVSGISTLGTIRISSGIVTATSGVVTYYGDGSNLTGTDVSIATTSLNQNYYLTYAIGVGNTRSILIDTAGLTYNPSTDSLGIGTTNPTTNLQVIGNASISGVVTATDFNSTSDIKLKTNINQIQNPIEKLKNINGVTFDWINDGRPSMGVIADEIQNILPELVSDTDPKTVNYNGLIGLLIECVKYQQNDIEELKRNINKYT